MTINYILLELEELAREELFRIKLVTKWKARQKKSKEKAHDCPICNEAKGIKSHAHEVDEPKTDLKFDINPPIRIPASAISIKTAKFSADQKSSFMIPDLKTMEEKKTRFDVEEYVETDETKLRLLLLKKHIDEIVKRTQEYMCEGLLSTNVENFLQSCEEAKSKIEKYTAPGYVDAKEVTKEKSAKLSGLEKDIEHLKALTTQMKKEGIAKDTLEPLLLSCDNFKGVLEETKEEKKPPSEGSEGKVTLLSSKLDEALELSGEAKDKGFKSDSFDNFINLCEDMKEKLEARKRFTTLRTEPPKVVQDLGSNIDDVMELVENLRKEGLLTSSVECLLKSGAVTRADIERFNDDDVKTLMTCSDSCTCDSGPSESTCPVCHELLGIPVNEKPFIQHDHSEPHQLASKFKMSQISVGKNKNQSQVLGLSNNRSSSPLVEKECRCDDGGESINNERSISETSNSLETERNDLCHKSKRLSAVDENSPSASNIHATGEKSISNIKEKSYQGMNKSLSSVKENSFIPNNKDISKTKFREWIPSAKERSKDRSISKLSQKRLSDKSTKRQSSDKNLEKHFESKPHICEEKGHESITEEGESETEKTASEESVKQDAPCKTCLDSNSPRAKNQKPVLKKTEDSFPCKSCQDEPQPLELKCDICEAEEEEEEQEETPDEIPQLRQAIADIEDNLGYFEKKVRRIVRLQRSKAEDGSVREERTTITIRKEKHDPTESAIDDDDDKDCNMSDQSLLKKDVNICLDKEEGQRGFKRGLKKTNSEQASTSKGKKEVKKTASESKLCSCSNSSSESKLRVAFLKLSDESMNDKA